MSISAAVQFCEKAGVALCFGPDTAPLGLEEKQLSQATEAAFQRLTSATDGIQLPLADIWKKISAGARPLHGSARESVALAG